MLVFLCSCILLSPFLIFGTHGRTKHRNPQLQHEPYPGKRYQAGNARAQVFAWEGV